MRRRVFVPLREGRFSSVPAQDAALPPAKAVLEGAGGRREAAERIMRPASKSLVLSVLTCKARYGVCASATAEPGDRSVEIGEAVRHHCAHRLARRGTQLTMRTSTRRFAGFDITQGSAALEELLKRAAKGPAITVIPRDRLDTDAKAFARHRERQNRRALLLGAVGLLRCPAS